MQPEPGDEDRRVVPRWRLSNRTPVPELTHGQIPTTKSRLAGEEELSVVEKRWAQERSLENAVDLINASVVFGERYRSVEAARFVVEHQTATPSAKSVAQRIHEPVGPKSSGNLGENAGAGKQRIRAQLSTIKKKLADYPRNSILHVEAARFYATLGQNRQAERHLWLARGLAPRDRFVLRSSVRFLVHAGKGSEAALLLRHIDNRDPWLFAAQISVRQLAGQVPHNIGQARTLLDADLHPSQLTELAAALATLELEGGNTKRAKKLIGLSQRSANDNSVAQIRWAAKKFGFTFNANLLEIPLSFEARARDALSGSRLEEAILECRRWLADEPFSGKPAALGCYVSAELLGAFQEAELFAEAGIQSNPNSGILWNNLAYVRACLGKIADARSALREATLRADSPRQQVILQATEGCLLFREGSKDAGRRQYKAAIASAWTNKLPDLAQRAAIHLLHEETRLGASLSRSALDRIRNRYEGGSPPTRDFILLYRALLRPELERLLLTAPDESGDDELADLLTN